MKRGIIFCLLTLGLILGAQARAAELKIGGEFLAGGLYLDKTTLKKDTVADGPSTAFYFQRLRLNSTFIIHPGLMLITRADIMKRAWGAGRSVPGTALDTGSAGTRAENENIALDWAYVQYLSPVGIFRVGYMNDNVWGTVFADGAGPKGKVAWSYVRDPWMVTVQIVKMGDNSRTATNPAVAASDVDNDKYCAAVRYSWKGGETGILGGVGRDATNKPAGNYKAQFYTLIPYAVVQVGPVKIQAEADYFWGKWKHYETSQEDLKLDSLSAWIDVTADFGKFYAAGSIAYVSGDDPGSADKIEANSLLVNGGRDWTPCLILFNSDLTYWAGNQLGHNAVMTPLNPSGYNGGPMTNAWFFQIRGGVRPIDKLDIMASVSYANADKKPWADPKDPATAYLYNDYGYELDVTATYKITNNLSYMLGAGYLFTGKYFKGAADSNNISDDYLLINKLTLTF
ncbi:MAG: hypothetical protein EG826_00140 [Deltaproteobacteria bacterium]|nr:hypothetical protein [Deltaproteobacteria bacterium]